MPEELHGRVEVGSLVRVPFRGRRVRGVVLTLEEGPSERELLPLSALVVAPPICPPPLDELAGFIATRYAVPLASALQRFEPPGVRVKPPPPEPLPDRPLSGALAGYSGAARLVDALESGRTGVWCLRTLAGADHGAIVRDLVAAAGRAGQGAALVCVPEVRYGSEVLDALEPERPERVDAATPDRERARAWLRLAEGHGLGAGGRATVLAPSPRLRLIVLDDEWHMSYRSDRSPRYDARRVAVERARLQGAVCVLMGATPSLETGYSAVQGRWGLAEPDRAAERAVRPIVEVAAAPTDRALAPELHQRIRDALRAGQRIALLAPHPGFARSLWCSACRRSLRCPRCEAGVAYDRSRRAVRCPHCGLTETAPAACPSCGAVEWRYLGAGSERLADQLRRSFPRATVRRMDPDVLAAGLPREQDGDIYVTTWIGTKPTLRPEVELVGVLNADALVRRPDFRAAERGYQALAAMSEWAGPAAEGGRLLIQTSDPGHHSVQAVVRGDYRFFLRRELDERRELRYPPFTELVNIRISGPHLDEVARAAGEAGRRGGGRVLGPVPLPGQDEPVVEMLIKCVDATRVARELRPLVAATSAPDRLRVDVDPR